MSFDHFKFSYLEVETCAGRVVRPICSQHETGVNKHLVVSLLRSDRAAAKWHVRVSKQSCKQANRLILWGVGAPQKKILDFFLFFFSKKLEKNDLTRPKVSKNSLTS
jgi:hypothetical protein